MSMDPSTLNGTDIGKRFRVTHNLGVTEGPLTHLSIDYPSVETHFLSSSAREFIAGGASIALTIGGRTWTFEQDGHGFHGPDVERVGA